MPNFNFRIENNNQYGIARTQLKIEWTETFIKNNKKHFDLFNANRGKAENPFLLGTGVDLGVCDARFDAQLVTRVKQALIRFLQDMQEAEIVITPNAGVDLDSRRPYPFFFSSDIAFWPPNTTIDTVHNSLIKKSPDLPTIQPIGRLSCDDMRGDGVGFDEAAFYAKLNAITDKVVTLQQSMNP